MRNDFKQGNILLICPTYAYQNILLVVSLIKMSAYGSKNTFSLLAKPIDVVEQQVEKQVLSLLLGLRHKQIVPQNVDIKQIIPQNLIKTSSFTKLR